MYIYTGTLNARSAVKKEFGISYFEEMIMVATRYNEEVLPLSEAGSWFDCLRQPLFSTVYTGEESESDQGFQFAIDALRKSSASYTMTRPGRDVMRFTEIPSKKYLSVLIALEWAIDGSLYRRLPFKRGLDDYLSSYIGGVPVIVDLGGTIHVSEHTSSIYEEWDKQLQWGVSEIIAQLCKYESLTVIEEARQRAYSNKLGELSDLPVKCGTLEDDQILYMVLSIENAISLVKGELTISGFFTLPNNLTVMLKEKQLNPCEECHPGYLLPLGFRKRNPDDGLPKRQPGERH